MGAFCSHIGEYDGVDPNKTTVDDNTSLTNTLGLISGNRGVAVTCNAFAFEDFPIKKNYDLVFTSPPYFDIEKYSYDDSQSFIRYPKYEDWKRGFLQVMIMKSFLAINAGGHFAINVAKPIDKDTLEIGNKIFGKQPETYYMRLSKILGQGNKGSVSHKTEPIFVWKKS